MCGAFVACSNPASDTEVDARCGDGLVAEEEPCDDGGDSADCDADCTLPECGDGYLNATAGEACDEGGDSADCDADCTLPECGDGYLNATAGEACDDGGDSADCDADCTPSECGDAYRNRAASEQCDDGIETATCGADCMRLPACGDGEVGPGEGCDAASPGCDDRCFGPTPSCGDGIVNSGPIYPDEFCDDYGIFTSRCDDDCSEVECGDGVVNMRAGEQCDPPRAGRCSEECVSLVAGTCGDGELNSGEACDAGSANGRSNHCASTCAGQPLVLMTELVEGTLRGGSPQYIELTNVGTATADLSSYELRAVRADGVSSINVGTGSSTALEPGESWVVADDADAYAAVTGVPADAVDSALADFSAGVTLQLRAASDGELLDEVWTDAYDFAGPFYTGFDDTVAVRIGPSVFMARNPGGLPYDPEYTNRYWRFGQRGLLRGLDAEGHAALTSPGTHDFTP